MVQQQEASASQAQPTTIFDRQTLRNLNLPSREANIDVIRAREKLMWGSSATPSLFSRMQPDASETPSGLASSPAPADGLPSSTLSDPSNHAAQVEDVQADELGSSEDDEEEEEEEQNDEEDQELMFIPLDLKQASLPVSVEVSEPEPVRRNTRSSKTASSTQQAHANEIEGSESSTERSRAKSPTTKPMTLLLPEEERAFYRAKRPRVAFTKNGRRGRGIMEAPVTLNLDEEEDDKAVCDLIDDRMCLSLYS
jgi:hypothetical protein